MEITIESNLIEDGIRVVGSWDDWQVERPLQLETNLLRNSYVNSVKMKLEKGKKYEFKFKNSRGEYFIDEHYPAMENEKGTMNNYLVACCYLESKTPRKVLESITKSNSVQETCNIHSIQNGNGRSRTLNSSRATTSTVTL